MSACFAMFGSRRLIRTGGKFPARARSATVTAKRRRNRTPPRKEPAMVNECPLCKHRVSDWMMASGKTTEIKAEVYHNACLIDFELRHGHKFGEKGGIGHDRTAGWTVGVPVHHSKGS